MKISYNWLKWYIPDAPEARELADIITYHLTEVESIEEKNGDFIFDLNILPNRAHDLLAHQGVARELSGQLGIDFNDPISKYNPQSGGPEPKPTNLQIKVNTDKCRRFSARIIRGVKVGPSPDWVVAHLASIGERSINNIVDATNIVMYDCGYPTHAFDLRKIKNEVLEIENVEKEEDLKLVGRDEIVAKLSFGDIVIKNTEGETLSLAGIKGGVNSGILDDTTDIVVEVANFDPSTIRKTARRIGVLSDAAKRFENDIHPEHATFAMMEISALIAEMCSDAVFEEIVDIYPDKEKWQEKRKISFTTNDVNKKIGSNILDSDIEKILNNYKYEFSKSGNVFEAVVPYVRLDLIAIEDMIEEIGRVYGYDAVKPELPKFTFSSKENEIYKKVLEIRNYFISNDYREVMTYTFANKGDVEILKSASDKKFLRTNLSDGLKKSYELNKLNAPLFGINPKELKIFEIGTIFKKDSEIMNVAFVDKNEIKEMSIEEFVKVVLSKEEKININYHLGDTRIDFCMWSPYPFITRDLSLWVDFDEDKNIVEDIIKNEGKDLLLGEPIMVDRFEKDEKISFSFRMIFQAQDRTLRDLEINQIMENISTKIAEKGFNPR